MTKLEQRNHLLYKLIAPVLQEVCIENLGEFGRIAFTRVSLSKDGKYLDIFVFIESRWADLRKALSDFAPRIQRHLAQAKVLAKMPTLRFKLDNGTGGERSVGDILAEIRSQYDLS